MKSAREKLIGTLEEVVILLQQHGEPDWSARISRDRDVLVEGDAYGAEHLLSAYGGMGSFNDLFLCPGNGHRIKESEVEPVNRQLQRLSSKAYKLAREIQRAV